MIRFFPTRGLHSTITGPKAEALIANIRQFSKLQKFSEAFKEIELLSKEPGCEKAVQYWRGKVGLSFFEKEQPEVLKQIEFGFSNK